MRITVEKRRTWVPDFEENMALPEDERIRISFDKPRAYRRREWQKVVGTRNGDGEVSSYVDTDLRSVILDSDVRVENLTIVEDGQERAITDGKALLEARSDVCTYLVTNLAAEILRQDYLSELPS